MPRTAAASADNALTPDVIPGAESFSFGLMVLGAGTVVTLLVLGSLAQSYATFRDPAIWVGVGVTLLIVAACCWRFLFGRMQLVLGQNSLAVVGHSGKVEREIAYAAIAAVELIEKTAVIDRHSELPRSPLGFLASETLRGPDISTQYRQTYLGLRFHDPEAGGGAVTQQQLLARARVRGRYQGCDWVIGADAFAVPLVEIRERLVARWQAWRDAAGN
jgi:hypothetical protein